jgi:hypothetical protein
MTLPYPANAGPDKQATDKLTESVRYSPYLVVRDRIKAAYEGEIFHYNHFSVAKRKIIISSRKI